MEIFHLSLRYLHITAGTFSLILFWFAAFAPKGKRFHLASGKWYVKAMWVTCISAIIASILNMLEGNFYMGIILAFLSLITINPLWHGVAILRQKKQMKESSRKLHLLAETLIFLFGGYILTLAILSGQPLFYIFGSLGFITGALGINRYRKPLPSYNWLFEHFNSMIISGAAAYTAFFAFGARHIFEMFSNSMLGVIPWVAPTILAISASIWLKKKI